MDEVLDHSCHERCSDKLLAMNMDGLFLYWCDGWLWWFVVWGFFRAVVMQPAKHLLVKSITVTCAEHAHIAPRLMQNKRWHATSVMVSTRSRARQSLAERSSAALTSVEQVA